MQVLQEVPWYWWCIISALAILIFVAGFSMGSYKEKGGHSFDAQYTETLNDVESQVFVSEEGLDAGDEQSTYIFSPIFSDSEDFTTEASRVSLAQEMVRCIETEPDINACSQEFVAQCLTEPQGRSEPCLHAQVMVWDAVIDEYVENLERIQGAEELLTQSKESWNAYADTVCRLERGLILEHNPPWFANQVFAECTLALQIQQVRILRRVLGNTETRI